MTKTLKMHISSANLDSRRRLFRAIEWRAYARGYHRRRCCGENSSGSPCRASGTKRIQQAVVKCSQKAVRSYSTSHAVILLATLTLKLFRLLPQSAVLRSGEPVLGLLNGRQVLFASGGLGLVAASLLVRGEDAEMTASRLAVAIAQGTCHELYEAP